MQYSKREKIWREILMGYEKGFIAITSVEWFDFIFSHDLKNANFWCKKKSFKALLPGQPLFFLKKNVKGEKGERKVVGFGLFNHFEVCSAQQAWELYGLGNGFDSYSNFYKGTKGILSTDNDEALGCIILKDITFFSEPVFLSDLNIPFASSIVSGKGISAQEVNTILAAGGYKLNQQPIFDESDLEVNVSDDHYKKREIQDKLLSNRDVIPMIQIITLSPDEKEYKGKSYQEIQEDFFIKTLPYREYCRFNHGKSGLDAPNNTLLLFRTQHKIIACARLIKDDKSQNCYHLYRESIRVFEPISEEELRNIDSFYKEFNNMEQTFPIDKLDSILSLINQKSVDYDLSVQNEELEVYIERETVCLSEEELLSRHRKNQIPRQIKKSEISVYYRDPNLKALVKKLAKGYCHLCENPAPFNDKYDNPYLEVHHVNILAKGGKDEIGNVVALCPNCHRKVHLLEDEDLDIKLRAIALHIKENLENR